MSTRRTILSLTRGQHLLVPTEHTILGYLTEMTGETFRNLAEILSERESISRVMQDALDEATDPWGVKAERVEM